jgi:hypothetical protein
MGNDNNLKDSMRKIEEEIMTPYLKPMGMGMSSFGG